MRVLRVQINPEQPGLKVAEHAALDAGLVRWMNPGETYEVSSDRHSPDVLSTVMKQLRNGDLAPCDEATAKVAGVSWKKTAAKHAADKAGS